MTLKLCVALVDTGGGQEEAVLLALNSAAIHRNGQMASFDQNIYFGCELNLVAQVYPIWMLKLKVSTLPPRSSGHTSQQRHPPSAAAAVPVTYCTGHVHVEPLPDGMHLYGHHLLEAFDGNDMEVTALGIDSTG
ncbi:uncharacterized protein PITG_00327 [Phytophthora infestans T30-4]|uniref:Uncharacterized protein n=1 Tax=Phytophthora infestans (strain T30-4) TaxID=403677 RepID=D0MQI5_PHYIT|nr:uncharacterized protein PITG_00327 [Phytophthora infestans T30-4]EEY57754.1 hypothetical protein PITG_00327 [Phytophthora infestans T30-4]|eukprot:XP_002908940.1 hypothetical protein PITG_00327 [Phytophthora infestans T30-4]